MNRRRMKVLGLLFLGFFLLTACGSQGNAGKPPSKKGLKIVTSFIPSMPWSRKSLAIKMTSGWFGQVQGSMIMNPQPRKWPRFMMRMYLSIILRPWNLGPAA